MTTPQQAADKDFFGVSFADMIQRAASLSRCGTYRFTLTRTWGEGGHVCFIGLNPSTADHRIDDPTVRRWIHFAQAWGYGGFTAVNLHPFRSASPAACREWSRWEEDGPDWYVRDVIQENLGIVVREAKAAALVVPCWGAGTWDPEWVDHLLEEVQTGEAPWPDLHCFALSQGGHPVHPMARGRNRIPDHAQPVLWRAGSPADGAAA
ncbi:DUF1643 domain-containing protein [Methylobacterium oxalidis]|uniref:DUF1643 domain-containing protein n=1 Tax=Methylobacterium oxalidis TaxID=944322 RepID=A0A512JA77_9HYPH|nr:DUF1643 domain-containing protein [Methylobacterium oxalidis]GEP06858.1 hypothetical protein MOX02_48960 [Methylobacterium oxalidis]GJE35005.1 hypothetical protein LDDCCGHA_5222 [Methylobacterium oxalidis]GLS67576.1 hypothetical protein GCM10007888_59600 [Methylobacterium oxalidis]